MKKHYDVLGLKKGASQEAIQEAYDKLSKELDPANNDNKEFFVEEYRKVQEAYEALSNLSILGKKEAKVSIKPKSLVSEKPSGKKTNNSFETDILTKYKQLQKKQSVTVIVLLLCIGFNYYLFLLVKGDNNAVKLSESYMIDAEYYSEKAKDYMTQAEDYMSQAEDYMSQAEGYMYQSEDYSSDSRRYMYQAEEYSNNAYYYSN